MSALFLFFWDVWITMLRLSISKLITKATLLQGLLIHWEVVDEYIFIWWSIWDSFTNGLWQISNYNFWMTWMFVDAYRVIGVYVSCCISKRTNKKSTLVKLLLHTVGRPHSLNILIRFFIVQSISVSVIFLRIPKPSSW